MDALFLERQASLLSYWDFWGTLLMFSGAVLFAAGIVCSLAVSIFTDKLQSLKIKILSFIAALCTALLAAFHPADVGNAFRQGWRELRDATERYEAAPTDEGKTAVLDARQRGEEIIRLAQERVLLNLGGGPGKSQK